MELKDKLFILAIRNANGRHISFLRKWLLLLLLKYQPKFHNVYPQDSQDTKELWSLPI